MVPVTIWHRSGFLSNKTNEKWPRVMTVVQIGDAHLGPDRPDRSESPSAERGCGTLGQAAARSGFPPPAGRGADRAPLPSLRLRSAGLSGRGGPGPGDGDWCSGLPGRAGRSAPYIDLYRGEIPGTCSAAAFGPPHCMWFPLRPALPGFVHLPLQRRDVGEGTEHVGVVQAVAHHPDVGNLKAQARSHGPFGATN